MNKRMLDNEDFDAIVKIVDAEHNTAYKAFREKAVSSDITYDDLLTMEAYSLVAFKEKYAHCEIELAIGEPIKLLPGAPVAPFLYLARSINEQKQKLISLVREQSIPVDDLAGELAKKVSEGILHFDEVSSDLVKNGVKLLTDYVIEQTPAPPNEILPLMIVAQTYSRLMGIPGPVTLSILTSEKDIREYAINEQVDVVFGKTSILGDQREIDLTYDLLKTVKDCLDKDIDSFSGRAFSNLRNKGAFLHDVEHGEPSFHKRCLLLGMAALSSAYGAKIEQIEELLSVTRQSNPNQIQGETIDEDIEDDSDFSPH